MSIGTYAGFGVGNHHQLTLYGLVFYLSSTRNALFDGMKTILQIQKIGENSVRHVVTKESFQNFTKKFSLILAQFPKKTSKIIEKIQKQHLPDASSMSTKNMELFLQKLENIYDRWERYRDRITLFLSDIKSRYNTFFNKKKLLDLLQKDNEDEQSTQFVQSKIQEYYIGANNSSNQCATCPRSFSKNLSNNRKILGFFHFRGVRFVHANCIKKFCEQENIKANLPLYCPPCSTFGSLTFLPLLACAFGSVGMFSLLFEKPELEVQNKKFWCDPFVFVCCISFFHRCVIAEMSCHYNKGSFYALLAIYLYDKGAQFPFLLLRNTAFSAGFGSLFNITVLFWARWFMSNNNKTPYFLWSMNFGLFFLYQVIFPMDCLEVITVDKCCRFFVLFLMLQDAFYIGLRIDLLGKLHPGYAPVAWQLKEIHYQLIPKLMTFSCKMTEIFLLLTGIYYALFYFMLTRCPFLENRKVVKVTTSLVEEIPPFILGYVCNYLFFLSSLSAFLKYRQYYSSHRPQEKKSNAFLRKRRMKKNKRLKTVR